MDIDREPVTRHDLDGALDGAVETLRGEMRDMEGRLRGEIVQAVGQSEERLRGEMHDMEKRLISEIGQAISHSTEVVIEHLGRQLGVIDEKYRDLPEQHQALRRELDEHRRDYRLHKRSRPG